MTGNPAKDTNPKAAIGATKVPYHLWPETATILGAMAFLEGALKYGRMNYRPMGAKASIYYDACRRHLTAWFEGEEKDPQSGLPHLGHALACLAILVDTQANGTMEDDRNYSGGYFKVLESMTPEVSRLKDKYADWETPHHWTIQDAPRKEEEPPRVLLTQEEVDLLAKVQHSNGGTSE